MHTSQPAEKIRRAIYYGATTFVLVPIVILVALWQETFLGPVFIPGAILLLFCLVITRWDMIFYPLPFLLFAVLLIIAYRSGGWMAVASSLIFLALLELICRRPGRGDSIVLVFPLNQGTYCVAHGGVYRWLNHHRGSRSQAYALDIVKLNQFGVRAKGICPRPLTAYEIFGDALYAPAPGIVTAVVNDLADLPPGEMDCQHIAGNHIVIRMDASDVSIGLAHLMQGSVRVEVGEQVCAGQILGRVGNSGNTTEPHLHIHAKRGGKPDSMLDGEAVPMRFGGRWLIRNSIVRLRAKTGPGYAVRK